MEANDIARLPEEIRKLISGIIKFIDEKDSEYEKIKNKNGEG